VKLVAGILLAAPGWLWAQPRIGLIDTYGQKRISPEKLIRATGLAPGEPLPSPKFDIETKLEEVDGVVRAYVEAECCTADGGVIVYLGVEERNAPHFEFRLDADDTEEARPDAAALLGDGPADQAVVESLQVATRDANPTVRAAAVRRLVILAKNPELRVLPTWIILMLNSVALSDRRIAVDALLELSEGGDPVLLGKIREEGLEALYQMAQWKHLPHALPPYLLLCRVAGISRAEAESSWTLGERDRVIARIRKELRKR
jgi:hypothetical protein